MVTQFIEVLMAAGFYTDDSYETINSHALNFKV